MIVDKIDPKRCRNAKLLFQIFRSNCWMCGLYCWSFVVLDVSFCCCRYVVRAHIHTHARTHWHTHTHSLNIHACRACVQCIRQANCSVDLLQYSLQSPLSTSLFRSTLFSRHKFATTLLLLPSVVLLLAYSCFCWSVVVVCCCRISAAVAWHLGIQFEHFLGDLLFVKYCCCCWLLLNAAVLYIYCLS